MIKTFKRASKSFEIMEYVGQENNPNPILADGSIGTVLNMSLMAN